MDCSTLGFPVHHQLPELAQTCVHQVSDGIQPSCLQSFLESGSFPMSQFFTLGGQSIRVSTSTSVLLMNIQDCFPLRLTVWISLQVQGTLKSLLQHHSSKASILLCSAFFIVQLSHPYMSLNVKSWALGSIIMNKAREGNGFSAGLFQIL